MLAYHRAPYHYRRMTDIGIDRERLTDALGEALAKVDTSLSLPPRLRLHESYCTVASIGIREYLNTLGVRSSLLISRPRLSFDRTMPHVFLDVRHRGESFILDSTYTQFLGYVGLTNYTQHERYQPDHAIAIVPSGERHQIVDTLIEAALAFDEKARAKVHHSRTPLVVPPLAGAGEVELRSAFSPIWAPENISPYRMSTRAAAAGYSVGRILTRMMSDDA